MKRIVLALAAVFSLSALAAEPAAKPAEPVKLEEKKLEEAKPEEKKVEEKKVVKKGKKALKEAPKTEEAAPAAAK